MHRLFIILFAFSCSAIPLTIYENARFQPSFPNLFLNNLSQIISRDECACQCYCNQWCLIAIYSGINQQCSLFFAWLQQGQLNLVITIKQSTVLYFVNKTLPLPTLLTGTNETIIGIWDTTAGSNSLQSSVGIQTGAYPSTENPQMAFDQLTTTKYNSYGVCNGIVSSLQCGLNTGLYLTPRRGSSLLVGIRFSTGNDHPNRDPIIITIEGSNQPLNALVYGSSWSLIYNGSTSLENITAREQFGTTQTLSNNYMWYSSYRILITSKRGNDTSLQYSEVELLGY